MAMKAYSTFLKALDGLVSLPGHLLLIGVLPHYRDAGGIFYNPSSLGCIWNIIAQSAEAVEYSDCISAKGWDTPMSVLDMTLNSSIDMTLNSGHIDTAVWMHYLDTN